MELDTVGGWLGLTNEGLESQTNPPRGNRGRFLGLLGGVGVNVCDFAPRSFADAPGFVYHPDG